MAIPVFDAASTAEQTAGATLTWAHTCTGSNLYLVVAVTFDDSANGGTVTGVTYNGVGMTAIDNHNHTAGPQVHWYGLANPATGANNIIASFTNGSDPRAQIGGGQSFTGVHQSSTWGTVAKEQQDGGETDVAATANSATDEMMVCACGCRSNATRTIAVKGTETQDWNEQIDADPAFNLSGGCHLAGTSGTTNVGFTLSSGTEFAVMVAALKPVGAGGLSIPIVQYYRQSS